MAYRPGWLLYHAGALLVVGGLALGPMAGPAQAAPRAESDRPDDQPGPQLHLLYVLPSDGQDRSLDRDGSIAGSTESWQRWLQDQTGGQRLRVDTAQGQPDISFVRLRRSNAQLSGYGEWLRDQIEYELVGRGFHAPDKLYLVYFEGGDARTLRCGSGPLPPQLPGSVVALYLRAQPAQGPACAEHRLAAPSEPPGYLEFAALHEIVHGLGLVPACAPRTDQRGHVGDNPADLMYAGPLAWQPATLDAGHDDYYRAGIPGCPDLAQSAFLQPGAAMAQPPPGWPYALLPPGHCPGSEGLASAGQGAASTVHFINRSDRPRQVYWLDAQGGWQRYRQLAGHEGYAQATYAGHRWLVADADGVCLATYQAGTGLGRALLPR